VRLVQVADQRVDTLQRVVAESMERREVCAVLVIVAKQQATVRVRPAEGLGVSVDSGPTRSAKAEKSTQPSDRNTLRDARTGVEIPHQDTARARDQK